ncbi:MAG: sugar ABC transporter ATP-binding protein [Pseudomonadota bacterium]
MVAPGDTALSLRDIDKVFPGVKALDSVSFDLRAGEVHVLLGENGAGKSTLMKILSGIYAPDGGEIRIGGEPVPRLTPETASAHRIGMVHQELCLVPQMSVAENILLGQMPKTGLGAIDWPQARRLASKVLDRLGVSLDPKREVGELEVAEQQLVEIAKVLSREPRIILLDEPTSALSDAERHRLFDVIKTLTQEGVGIIYISHHLSEVPMIGDRVSVLRDGKMVGTLPARDVPEAELVTMMVGRAVESQFQRHRGEPKATALEARGLSLRGHFDNLDFKVRYGEVLGIFGLMGAGQAELVRVLFGLTRPTAGQLLVDGEPQNFTGPSDAIAKGLALIYRDRRESLVPLMPPGPNMSLAWLSDKPPWARLERARERDEIKNYIGSMNIEPPLPDREIMFFSGGNQQKVVLSRWMSSGSRILIFDEPARGIDVGAKAQVFALMDGLAAEGAAIIMVSSEPAELSGMADRTLVMRKGQLATQLMNEHTNHQTLLSHAG